MLCEMIPHSGDMCLLDEVIKWDADSIECRSSTHMDQNNPLRNEHGLPSVALIEYGAQAMAVHGGLLAREQGGQISEGYLAALREVDIKDMFIDSLEQPLIINADKVMAQGGNMVYQFSVKAGEQVLASGRATVISQAG
jgi:predicted hotdog family 3-hydroxylacyl-ACP dehydratase